MEAENLNVHPWRVLQTRSRSEKKAAALLQKMGIELYLPLQKRRKKWSDRVKIVEEPLFSGYIFAKFTEELRYPMLNTPGVVRIVSFGGAYASVPEAQIEALRQLAYLDNEVVVVDAGLLPGQEVRIASGPFKGFHGRLVRHDGKGKLVIEIVAIGKGIVLELGRTKVAALPKTAAQAG
ncbi:UpxY family transcription antiterminator [Persicitalea sp.]|uniref:UpxY family transcription antiterminator n=1 Tax=Persicitalea sp. TaxID=3100273 RepID=UPI003593FF6C